MQQEGDEVIDYFTHCGVYGESNRFYALIHCDRCGCSYPLECVYPPLDTVTLEEWFCSDCS